MGTGAGSHEDESPLTLRATTRSGRDHDPRAQAGSGRTGVAAAVPTTFVPIHCLFPWAGLRCAMAISHRAEGAPSATRGPGLLDVPAPILTVVSITTLGVAARPLSLVAPGSLTAGPGRAS
jgi:hypothetical protein